MDPLKALFANVAAIFTYLAPNSQFLRNLYPIKPFLKQLYQLVLNIWQFLDHRDTYLLGYIKISIFYPLEGLFCPEQTWLDNLAKKHLILQNYASKIIFLDSPCILHAENIIFVKIYAILKNDLFHHKR